MASPASTRMASRSTSRGLSCRRTTRTWPSPRRRAGSSSSRSTSKLHDAPRDSARNRRSLRGGRRSRMHSSTGSTPDGSDWQELLAISGTIPACRPDVPGAASTGPAHGGRARARAADEGTSARAVRSRACSAAARGAELTPEAAARARAQRNTLEEKGLTPEVVAKVLQHVADVQAGESRDPCSGRGHRRRRRAAGAGSVRTAGRGSRQQVQRANEVQRKNPKYSARTKYRDEREEWVKNLPPVIGTDYWPKPQ